MGRPRNHIFANSLLPDWDAVLCRVEDRHDRSQLHRVADYCSAKAIGPLQVCTAVLEQFEAVAGGHRLPRPHQIVRDAARTWNARACAEGWPVELLEMPASRRPDGLSPSDLPPAFREDVETFLDRAGGTDLFDDPKLKPLSPATKVDRRRKIYQLAHRLIASGHVDTVTRLSDLVEGKAYEAILVPLWNDGANGHAYNLARVLTHIARYWVKSPADVVTRLKNAEGQLKPDKRGMTDKNDKRIRHFENPANVRRLLLLPERVFARVDHRFPTVMDAVAVQSALAIAILLVAPIRERNLAMIDMERHVQRVGPTHCQLVFLADEVKNHEDLDLPLSPRVIRLMDIYVEVYRPLLAKRGGTALFVSFNGRQKAPHEMGAQITKFIKDETGLNMNAHVFRHLAAFLYLSAHPREYETVRRLLGHKSQKTTVEFYLRFERQEAFRELDRVLDRRLAEAADVAP